MRFYERWLQKVKRASGKHGYTCDSCGEEVFDYPVRRLCKVCETRLEENDGRVCEKCGRKVISEGVCTTCKSRMPLFYKGISPFVYRADTALLVNRIKNGDRRLAFYFGEKMAQAFLREFPAIAARFSGEVLLLPVPLTVEKRRERGYNQAQELAEVAAEYLCERRILATLDLNVLERKGEDVQQKHLDSAARKQNADNAYRLQNRKVCKGKIIVLIDDILTTGATGSACAQRLIKAGASCVILLTIAALPEKK